MVEPDDRPFLPGPIRAMARPVRGLLRRLDHAAFGWLLRRVSSQPPLDADAKSIHFFVASLNTGGTEHQIVALVEALSLRGFHCKVWVVEEGGSLTAEVLRHGALVEGIFAGIRPMGVLSRAIYRVLLPPALALARGLRRERPRVLQCFHEETNVIGALAGRLARVPVVALGLRGVHPKDPGWKGEGHWSGPYDLLDPRSADAIVVNSEAGRRSFLHFEPSFPPGRIHLVRNRVVPPRREGRAGPRPAGSPPLILWMGRLSPEKRPDLFVAVLARLLDLHVPFEAWVAGEGKLLNAMKAQVDEAGLGGAVEFLGDVSLVGDLLDAARVLVLCSDVEGLPNAILEAQHSACPVVATAVGGVPELIVDGVTGFLVPPGDVEGLSARVCEILADPERAARIGTQGRESVLRHFSGDLMVEETLQVYRQAETARARAGER